MSIKEQNGTIYPEPAELIESIRRQARKTQYKRDLDAIRKRVMENMDSTRLTPGGWLSPANVERIEQIEDDRCWLMTDVTRITEWAESQQEDIKKLHDKIAQIKLHRNVELTHTQDLLAKKAEVDLENMDDTILAEFIQMRDEIASLQTELELTRVQYEDERAFAQTVETSLMEADEELSEKRAQIEMEQEFHERLEYELKSERLHHESTMKDRDQTENQLKVMTQMRDALHIRLEKMSGFRDNLLASNNEQFDLLQEVQDLIRKYIWTEEDDNYRTMGDWEAAGDDLATAVQELLDRQGGLS